MAPTPIRMTHAIKIMGAPHPAALSRSPMSSDPLQPPIRFAALIMPVAVDRMATGKRKELSTFNAFHEKTLNSE